MHALSDQSESAWNARTLSELPLCIVCRVREEPSENDLRVRRANQLTKQCVDLSRRIRIPIQSEVAHHIPLSQIIDLANGQLKPREEAAHSIGEVTWICCNSRNI
jgi:hypothetical protein